MFSLFKNKKDTPAASSDDLSVQQQDKKNRDFVVQIIEGNYQPLSAAIKKEAKEKFVIWQQAQKRMFQEVPQGRISKLNALIEQRNWHNFQPIYSDLLPTAVNKEIFLADAFTEPFPSTHDMESWALGTQITDIFCLNDISYEASKNYVVHTKHHFANHSMVQAIIWFDIYKL